MEYYSELSFLLLAIKLQNNYISKTHQYRYTAFIEINNKYQNEKCVRDTSVKKECQNSNNLLKDL